MPRGDPILLVLVLVLLWDAAVRAASPAIARGPARVLAAFTLLVAWAVLAAMVLSLAGLLGSGPAHVALAVASWAAAWRLPRPAVRLRDELRHAAPGGPARLLAGVAGGGTVAAAIWCAANPIRSFDGMTYHAAT